MSRTARRSPAPGPGLAGRLLAALALVLVTAGVTAWLVAGVVGPAIFHDHLLHTDARADDAVLLHAEEAFRSAGAVSLLLALAAASGLALLVGVYLARRVSGSLRALTTGVHHVAGGRFGARVPPTAMGAEFDELAQAFNQMAGRLEASEALRRRLLSDVAHELRTPVATLNAQLESLEDGLSELTPDTVRILREQGSRLTRLSRDLAAVTHAESGETVLARRHADPADLLRSVAAAAAPLAAEKGVEIRVVASSLPPLDVDPERMGQVLTNLVDNAVRHTPRDGVVTVRGSGAPSAVVLEVEDTGEGIAPEHLPHLFERFYRAETARDRASGGSGIGLAISKALVEAHGGVVTARSAGLGHGSTFTVTLPR